MSGALLFLFLVCEKIVSSIERPPSSLRAAPPEKGARQAAWQRMGWLLHSAMTLQYRYQISLFLFVIFLLCHQ